MKQSELIDSLHKRMQQKNSEATKGTIKQLLHSLEDVIRSELEAGGSISLAGIGKLTVSTHAARTGRNPMSGEPIVIPKKIHPKFSPASALRVFLNSKPNS
jgi:DNA-binding protein HU-beta